MQTDDDDDAQLRPLSAHQARHHARKALQAERAALASAKRKVSKSDKVARKKAQKELSKSLKAVRKGIVDASSHLFRAPCADSTPAAPAHVHAPTAPFAFRLPPPVP